MEPDDNSFKGSRKSSIDKFFIDDDPIQTSQSMQGSSHLTRIVPGSNINDHSECQEHLRMQRQKMEQKDFEISKYLSYIYARPLNHCPMKCNYVFLNFLIFQFNKIN